MTRTTSVIRVGDLGIYEWGSDEWERYGTVTVGIDGAEYEVGVVIGVPETLRQTVTAANDDPARYVSAWYGDSGDWSDAPCLTPGVAKGIPAELAPAVLAAIREAAPRLWQEYREDRESE